MLGNHHHHQNHGWGWGWQMKEKEKEKLEPEDIGQLIFLGLLKLKKLLGLGAALKGLSLLPLLVLPFILCTLLFWGILVLLFVFLPAPAAGRDNHPTSSQQVGLSVIEAVESGGLKYEINER